MHARLFLVHTNKRQKHVGTIFGGQQGIRMAGLPFISVFIPGRVLVDWWVIGQGTQGVSIYFL